MDGIEQLQRLKPLLPEISSLLTSFYITRKITKVMKPGIDWILRIVPALILLQTLFFKYTGAEESVYIFQQMGIEPWGRYLIATLELISAITLLIPQTAALGALFTLGIMLGALGGHLSKLGIEVAGDGGFLFVLAIVVTICSATVAWSRKGQLLTLLGKRS